MNARFALAIGAVLLAACGSGNGTGAPGVLNNADISYDSASPGDPNRIGDLWRPAVPKPDSPAVVLMHGGIVDTPACVGARKDSLSQVAKDLAGQGFWVFNIDVRLAPASSDANGDCVPDNGFEPYAEPAQADAQAAVSWLKAQFQVQANGAYQASARRVSAMGYSAGGANALRVAYRATDSTSSVRSAVALASVGECVPSNPVVQEWFMSGCSVTVPSTAPSIMTLNGDIGDSPVPGTTPLFALMTPKDGYDDDGVIRVDWSQATCDYANNVSHTGCQRKVYAGTQYFHTHFGQPGQASYQEILTTAASFMDANSR